MKLPYANKDLGQHFLKDKMVIDTICADHLKVTDAILEIGPGPGILSQKIYQNILDHNLEIPYYVIEKDSRFLEYLEPYVNKDKIEIADALNFELDLFFQKNSLRDKKIWLISNLPYNISAPLFIKFLPIETIKFMTLMFQKEVAEKIFDPNSEKKSSIGILGDNFFDIKKLLNVSPGAFLPPPKVQSIVLSFIRKEIPKVAIKDFQKFETFLRKLFSNRRKQLFKVLSGFFNKEDLSKSLLECSIEKSIRAEDLNTKQVIALYQSLGK